MKFCELCRALPILTRFVWAVLFQDDTFFMFKDSTFEEEDREKDGNEND